jgi:hypothetical protein
MEKFGFIEIKITGSKGNHDLSPENYDIREVIAMLENAESLLYHGDKKERPIISYDIQKGSVKNIFRTSLQYIIGFNAIIGQINEVQNIDFLDISTAKAFENIQNIAVKKNYNFLINTSMDNTNAVTINKDTNFVRMESIWVDAEFYFYGKIINAGGKGKQNIHIQTDDVGTVIVQTPVSFFENLEENIIHKKTYGVRAIGKQHSETGEIDTTGLKFVELVDFEPKYDEQYLKKLRDKAKKSWLGNIDADSWLKEIRGGYDA